MTSPVGGTASARVDLMPWVVRFAQRLRAAGVAASPDRVQAFVAALDTIGAGDPHDLYLVGRVTLCADRDELARYDVVVAEVFGGVRTRPTRRTLVEVLGAGVDGGGPEPPPGDDEQQAEGVVASASRTERLRHADIADLDATEREDLHRLLTAFRLPGDLRRTRRHQPWHRGALDHRATTRGMLAAGGEPARLARRRHRSRPRDVVVLADVSGSMAAYAHALLRFAHAASRGHRADVEVFTLGTRLTRVTREMSLRDPDHALQAVGRAVPDWSGGTRLGDGVRAFLDGWGQRGTARGAVVVVLSDGWERGDPALLGDQLARLARLARRVVWANPRAGRDGFAPTAGGMAAALPSIDVLLPANTLAALEDVAAAVAGRATREQDRVWRGTDGA